MHIPVMGAPLCLFAHVSWQDFTFSLEVANYLWHRIYLFDHVTGILQKHSMLQAFSLRLLTSLVCFSLM